MSNNYVTKDMKDRIYACMRYRNITSSDLCRVLNVAYPDLKATFDGKSPLYNKWQKKIAEVLCVDKEELFKEFYMHKPTEEETIGKLLIDIDGYVDDLQRTGRFSYASVKGLIASLKEKK